MALTNPTNTALRGHRFLVILKNAQAFDGAYKLQLSRLQDLAIDWNTPMDVDYEIGNIDPVGSSFEPVEPAATLAMNMVSTAVEAILSGTPFTTLAELAPIGSAVLVLSNASQCGGFTNSQKIVVGRAASYESATIATVSSPCLNLSAPLAVQHAAGDLVTAHQITAGDFLDQTAIAIYQLIANQNAGNPPATVLAERVVTGAAVARLNYSFAVGAGIAESISLEGTDIYDESVPTQVWGAFNTTDPGSIKGKDAIISIGASTLTADVAYRVQSFNISIAFPIAKVKEIGNRIIVGVVIDPPTVTVDFDLLEADLQPDALLGNISGSQYKFDVLTANDLYIRVYDGRVTRALIGVAQSTKPVKAFKIDNVIFANGGVRNVVRGFGTKRFSGQVQSVDVSGTGGLTIYSGDIT